MRSFGRLRAADARDQKFLVAPLLRPKTERTTRYWHDGGWWGNQGNQPQCVAYAWAHWLEDGPITHAGPAPIMLPNDIYREAQKIDEWPGEDYEGTSVRAAAKVLRERGWIDEYRWARTLDEVVQTILQLGPVVVGTNWTEGMCETNSMGFLSPTGDVLGGHAYVLNGVSLREKKFRVKNSWGRMWGSAGRAWMRFTAFERLLGDDGEACLAIEAKELNR